MSEKKKVARMKPWRGWCVVNGRWFSDASCDRNTARAVLAEVAPEGRIVRVEVREVPPKKRKKVQRG